MIEIDITSDINEAIDEVGDFFRNDIPFVTAVSINNTLFDVRKRNVGSTYPKAFKTRNTTFPKINWTIDKVAIGGGGRSQNMKASSGLKAFKGGWSNNMYGMYRQKSLNGGMREWTETHANKGTKFPKTSSMIAIPTNGDPMRNKGGSISKRNKPLNITNKNDTFLMHKNGRKAFIASRSGKDLKILYVFSKTAQMNKTYRFYEDAFDTIDRVILPHWGTALMTVVARSRFDPA